MPKTKTTAWQCDLCIDPPGQVYHQQTKPRCFTEVVYRSDDDMRPDGYMLLCKQHADIIRMNSWIRELFRPGVRFE